MGLSMATSEDEPAPAGSSPKSKSELQMADEDIRRLLARELHDRVAQTLTSMLIDLENFKVEQVGREGVLRQMDTLQDSTRGVLNSLRELLYELRGGPGVEEGFLDALRALAGRFSEKTRIDTNLSILPGWPARVTSPAALNLYRIVEEALANVRQHSGARAVQIILQPHSENELSVCVSDDGRGLDLEEPGPIGMGIVGMKERALFLGAQLRVETSIGSGTTVRVIVPREQL
jgi:two-component system, NarL family, sensor histidine kinase UhpB